MKKESLRKRTVMQVMMTILQKVKIQTMAMIMGILPLGNRSVKLIVQNHIIYYFLLLFVNKLVDIIVQT